jgi:hypothetical protein
LTRGAGPRHRTRARPPVPQGHDDVGRPLLQRALAIREAALGRDYADVVDMRDVLNGNA